MLFPEIQETRCGGCSQVWVYGRSNQARLRLGAAVPHLAPGRRGPQIEFQRHRPLGHISRPASGPTIFDQTTEEMNRWTAPPNSPS